MGPKSWVTRSSSDRDTRSPRDQCPEAQVAEGPGGRGPRRRKAQEPEAAGAGGPGSRRTREQKDRGNGGPRVRGTGEKEPEGWEELGGREHGAGRGQGRK